jgi:hypothetical protein
MAGCDARRCTNCASASSITATSSNCRRSGGVWPEWLGEAQRLRERLGKHQDLLALEALTAPHEPLAHWRARLAPAIAERKAAHVAAASRIAARLLVEKPKAFRHRLDVIWETET